nr:hypothetical 42K protein - yeast (Saccharomyces cerevisiae) [Saccharomyces cerevisiae]
MYNYTKYVKGKYIFPRSSRPWLLKKYSIKISKFIVEIGVERLIGIISEHVLQWVVNHGGYWLLFRCSCMRTLRGNCSHYLLLLLQILLLLLLQAGFVLCFTCSYFLLPDTLLGLVVLRQNIPISMRPVVRRRFAEISAEFTHQRRIVTMYDHAVRLVPQMTILLEDSIYHILCATASVLCRSYKFCVFKWRQRLFLQLCRLCFHFVLFLHEISYCFFTEQSGLLNSVARYRGQTQHVKCVVRAYKVLQKVGSERYRVALVMYDIAELFWSKSYTFEVLSLLIKLLLRVRKRSAIHAGTGAAVSVLIVVFLREARQRRDVIVYGAHAAYSPNLYPRVVLLARSLSMVRSFLLDDTHYFTTFVKFS